MTALLTTVAQLVIGFAVVPFALLATVLWAVGEACTWLGEKLAVAVIGALRISGAW